MGCTETDSPTPSALELNRSVTLTQRIRTNLTSSKRRARVAVLGHRELITINTSGAEAIACARRRARHTEASIAVAVGATLVCVELRRIRATRTIGTDTATSGGAASAHILSRVTNFHGLHTHTHQTVNARNDCWTKWQLTVQISAFAVAEKPVERDGCELSI